MPRHTREPAVSASERRSLIDELVKELREPKPSGQPVILEDRTPQTKSMRVNIIWDRWDECPRELRSDIIVDAYDEAFPGEKMREMLTFALGITFPEAIEASLLPFQVVPWKPPPEIPASSRSSREEHHAAMVKEGAIQAAGGGEPQLWFATLEDAQGAVRRLTKAIPLATWFIIRHTPEPSTTTTSPLGFG